MESALIARLPSLRNIETFVCLSEVSSLRRASERLNITVSAVSHRIHALEAEVKAKLFERSGRGLRLTQAGRNYLAALAPAFKSMREAVDTISVSPTVDTIRVLAPGMFLSSWLLPRLSSFMEMHPHFNFELITLGSRKTADITIAPMTIATGRKGAIDFFDVIVFPICTPDFARRNHLKAPADLMRVPLIDIGDESWLLWLARAGLDPNVAARTIRVDTQPLMYDAVVRGLGVGMGASYLIEDQLASAQVIRPFNIACRLSSHMSLLVRQETDRPAQRAFATWVREQFTAHMAGVQAAGGAGIEESVAANSGGTP